jgi:sporulation integral membrane protein YtvI
LAGFYLLYYYVFPAVRQVLNAVIPWILPFFAGWFLAALLDPVVNWLENRARWPRTLASLVVVLILSVGLAAVVGALVAQLAIELSRLAAELPRYGAALKEGIAQLDALYRGLPLPPQVREATEAGIEAGTEYLRAALSRLVQELVQLASGLPRFFVSLIVTIVATFFFSRDKVLIKDTVLSLFPRLGSPRLMWVAQQVGAGVMGYFKAQSFLIAMTAVQVFAGLHILQVKYALSLSLFVAILDLLPIVGPSIVFLPWAGWEVLNRRYTLGLALLVLYATISVVRQVLEPKVVGKTLGLHPLAALASIYIGVQAIGLEGAIIGPLFLVCLKAAYRAGFFRSRPS